MDMATIIALLRREIGLNPDSIGENVVQQAIDRRIFATNCKDVAEYVARLSGSGEEVQELVEEVTVPETWFFREETAFECLRRQAMKPSNQGALMVASLPCATGEEPYSIAMSLLELQVPRFRVHALDISHRALLRAELGEYGEHAFRTADKTFRRHYFAPTATAYRINQTVRDQVSFYHGSVLAPPPPFSTGSFDVVFCRNLLIYLDEDARKKVVTALKRMLTPQGILLVGHAETSILVQQGFKRREDGALILAVNTPAITPQVSRPKRPARPTPTQPGMMPFSDVKPAEKRPDPECESAAIRSLADQGQLDEARQCCEKLLAAGQHSAELYCLLGLISHATGDADAARDCFRKALYLDPKHQEASLQLAMLLDKAGEAGRANSLRAAARKSGEMNG